MTPGKNHRTGRYAAGPSRRSRAQCPMRSCPWCRQTAGTDRCGVRPGKVTVDTAHAGLAEFRHLLEQASGNLRRGVIGIDQHGKTRQSLRFGFHRGTLGCGTAAHIDVTPPILEKASIKYAIWLAGPRLSA